MQLQTHQLHKWFGQEPDRTHIIKGIDLSVSSGEMLYIVGPSGSGKTTFLSMISGILRPTSGEVTVDGVNIWDMEEDARAHFRLYSLGFVFQDFHLFPNLNCQENVALPLILQNQPWDSAMQAAKLQLELVNLKSKLDLQPNKLSIGEQQRVAIARALVVDPAWLILDEPTASLDGEMGKKIIHFIKEELLNDRRGVIVVTHDNRIFGEATRLVKLEDGKLVDHEEL